jgi:hypothetical protein
MFSQMQGSVVNDMGTSPAELRRSAALHAYLREAHETWRRGQDIFGDGRNAALVRLVMIGWLERKPYDHSSLSEAMRMSRQQLMRRVDCLEEAGWLLSKRQAHRVIVMPTEALIDQARDHYDNTLPKVVTRWAKVATLFAALGKMVDVVGDVAGMVQ